jgi:hypothetical protein
MLKYAIIFSCLAIPIGSAFGQLALTELNKEDVIFIYDVPVKDRPAYKYEWKVTEPTTFRLVLESRRNEQSPWSVVQETTRSVDKKVFLTVLLDQRPGQHPTVVPMRWGFEDGTIFGWSSFDAILQEPITGTEISYEKINPDQIVVLHTASITYRVCIQKSPRVSK